MNVWLLVAALTLGNVGLKVVGPLSSGGRTPPAPVSRVIALLTPALIPALVVAGTFARGSALVLDARAAGVAVGAVALWFRAPAAIALVLAAATTAALRAVT